MSQKDEVREADLRLLESEQRYEAVIENASDMIQSVRPDGTFEFVNGSWHKVMGYTDADLEHMTIWDLIHADSIEHCQIEFYRAIQGEPIDFIEMKFVAKDGRAVPIEGSVTSRFVGDEIVATHGFFRDVTERNRTRELEARAEKLEREERARYLEKMAALGKLSAGLAHELNNPAAAIQRAAASLKDTLRRRDAAMQALHESPTGPTGWLAINALVERATTGTGAADQYDSVAISMEEETLEVWLEDHAIGDAWTIAPSLAEGGITAEDLDSLVGAVPQEALPCSLAWITETLAMRESADIITQSGLRISDLVQSIKGYSHMDRATELEANIHDGIEDTLVILGHRLRDVRVAREFDRSLPPIRMLGNSLNQVWTNLLDNAIDAMDGTGMIRIHTGSREGQLIVEIEDTGKGILPEALPRIFEPFYTSKPQGQGTGLGLDTVWRIVTEEHGGTIDAESQPGKTVFRVSLPATDIT